MQTHQFFITLKHPTIYQQINKSTLQTIIERFHTNMARIKIETMAASPVIHDFLGDTHIKFKGIKGETVEIETDYPIPLKQADIIYLCSEISTPQNAREKELGITIGYCFNQSDAFQCHYTIHTNSIMRHIGGTRDREREYLADIDATVEEIAQYHKAIAKWTELQLQHYTKI